MKTDNHLYRVTLGFYGYDELRERYVIAKDISTLKIYVVERWSPPGSNNLMEIKEIEYVDVVYGTVVDHTPDRHEVIDQINELRGIHE